MLVLGWWLVWTLELRRLVIPHLAADTTFCYCNVHIVVTYAIIFFHARIEYKFISALCSFPNIALIPNIIDAISNTTRKPAAMKGWMLSTLLVSSFSVSLHFIFSTRLTAAGTNELAHFYNPSNLSRI